MIRIGLIQFPGSNCERETALAIKRACMEPVDFLWNEPLEKLRTLDGYVLIGGFSYEDRSRAGIIAALDPVMQEIKIQSEQGKPVLGICNGAQILVEAGFVPDLNLPHSLALAENKRIENGTIGTGFYNVWVTMRLAANYQHNAFTRHLSPNSLINLPIAHGEGRFLMPEPLLNELTNQGLNVFQYCDAQGIVIDNFPINPNGSSGNIAAITNKAGNVMAIMPHPERTPNGDPIFTSMRDYIASSASKLNSLPPPSSTCSRNPEILLPSNTALDHFKKIPGSYQCLTKLIITDNHALTVQKTLRRLGIPVTVARFVHWEIECDSPESLELIKKSELLYSPRKEREVVPMEYQENTLCYLVRPQEDLKGQQTLQRLKTHFQISSVTRVNYSLVWHFTSVEANVALLDHSILLTHIIGNQYAHQCYLYDHSV
jgi:phosphoribosylformylglycinamidine synthase I